MSEKKLARRLAALQRRVDLIQALMSFSAKHPAITPYCKLFPLSSATGLYFEEKGFIRPVWNKGPTLRLETYVEDSENESDRRIVSEDISRISPDDLARVLKEQLGVDLNKAPGWEEGDDNDEDNNNGAE